MLDRLTNEVRPEHNQGRLRACAITHTEIWPELVPDRRLEGYAYRRLTGWRITTADHRRVVDHCNLEAIIGALTEWHRSFNDAYLRAGRR